MTSLSAWAHSKAAGGRADELAELLGRATGFVFEPDLPDILPGLAHNWVVRLDGSGDAWVLRWAYSSRCWSKRRGDWLTSIEMEHPWTPQAPWWDEVHFGFAAALEALPGILALQAERAREADAQRRAQRQVPVSGLWSARA